MLRRFLSNHKNNSVTVETNDGIGVRQGESQNAKELVKTEQWYYSVTSNYENLRNKSNLILLLLHAKYLYGNVCKVTQLHVFRFYCIQF